MNLSSYFSRLKFIEKKKNSNGCRIPLKSLITWNNRSIDIQSLNEIFLIVYFSKKNWNLQFDAIVRYIYGCHCQKKRGFILRVPHCKFSSFQV